MGLWAPEGWSFIPGPRRILDPPGLSTDLHDVASYDAREIAAAILAHPGCRPLHPAVPTWWDWRAEWRAEGRSLTLGMSLFEEDPPTWGGSEIEARCELEDLMGLWSRLRGRFPAVWLHNRDCEVHTPESFRRLFAG